MNYGIQPYDREWDVLIVLDACRHDLFENFAPEHPVYERFQSVEPVYSCASASQEWLRKAFKNVRYNVLSGTHYITANGWAETELDNDQFGSIEHVWKWAHDPELGTVPPEPVTDQAIVTYRKQNPNRLIVHYMQPHAPFIHASGKYQSTNEVPGEGNSQNVWKGIQQRELDADEVWADYGKNLLTVLDDVETIVQNVNGIVALTADHGNALGEWGIYGHPGYVPTPTVKRVPWAIAKGEGYGTYEPNAKRDSEEWSIEDNKKDHLADLGYI
jgi:hypothetical protein